MYIYIYIYVYDDMVMTNCFCGMVDRRKAFSLIYKFTIFLRLSLIKPNELLDVLNNLNPAITMETSDTQLPFINIMINKDGKKVLMDIYSKLTDSNMSRSNQTNRSLS